MGKVAIFRSRSQLRYDRVVADFLQIRSRINSVQELRLMMDLRTIHSFYEDEKMYMGQRAFVTMVSSIGQLESFSGNEWQLCCLLEQLNHAKWDRLALLSRKYISSEMVTCANSEDEFQLTWLAWLHWYCKRS